MIVRINLKGCYGIKELDKSFMVNDKPVIIHAPNGTMKTSLKKTIDDLAAGNLPKDLVSGAAAKASDIFIDGNKLGKDNLKAFAYDSDIFGDLERDVATMLISSKEKANYQNLRIDYNKAKEALLEKLRSHFSNKAPFAEASISQAFGKTFDDVLLSLTERDLLMTRKPLVNVVNYSDAFSADIKKAVESTKSVIKDYSALVNKAATKCGVLKKGVFEFADLEAVASVLNAHGFFNAGHKVILSNSRGAQTVSNTSEMNAVIDKVKATLSADPAVYDTLVTMQQQMEKSRVAKKPLKLIEDQPFAANEYCHYSRFEKQYIKNLLRDSLPEFNSAREALLNERKERARLARETSSKTNDWKKAIDVFNERFDFGFKIRIADHNGEFLTNGSTKIEFVFDGLDGYPKESEAAKNILSSSQLRAVFLLDVVFQTERFLESNTPGLLLYDDISDSFDYTNKNCIMEYFRDLSQRNGRHCMVFLTHNFDFYRLFANRISDRSHAYFAAIENGKLEITEGGYLKDVLSNGLIAKTRQTIRASFALVPFARGIIELTSSETDINNDAAYVFVCEFMHFRPVAVRHTLGMLQRGKFIPPKIKNALFIDGTPRTRNYYKELGRTCAAIAGESSVYQRLEDKLTLALGIRIFSEKYCYQKLRKSTAITLSELDRLMNSSFGDLLKKFKDVFPRDKKMKDLELAAMLTCTDLHLNNFVYEPLIDYSITRLRRLYNKIA